VPVSGQSRKGGCAAGSCQVHRVCSGSRPQPSR
jgi:hypothetical protein